MWVIMTLTLSLFHGEGAGHFIAVGSNDGPHEWLIRLTYHISGEEFPSIFNRYSIFGFLYRSVDADLGSCRETARPRAKYK